MADSGTLTTHTSGFALGRCARFGDVGREVRLIKSVTPSFRGGNNPFPYRCKPLRINVCLTCGFPLTPGLAICEGFLVFDHFVNTGTYFAFFALFASDTHRKPALSLSAAGRFLENATD